MIVDDELVATAHRLLDRRFGERAGAATALYTLEGSCHTSVAVPCTNPGSSVEPETGALVAAYAACERVSALVTVERRTNGGPVLYATPSGPTLDRMALVGAREAELVVHNLADEDSYFIRPLKSLHTSHISEMWLDGNFDDGMAPIGRQLRELARVQGIPTTREQWAPCFRSALASDLVRRYAQHQGKRRHPFEFRHPNEVASRPLRHVWHAFEAASHAFFRSILGHHEATLRDIGCNDSDLLHLRQGSEAFRYVFANVIVWVAWHQPVENELPFAPYRSTRLRAGDPMHVAFADSAPPEGDSIDELVHLLTQRGPGGLAHYLRDRELFTQHVFDNGTGRCPFDAVALQIFRETGAAIADARDHGLLDEDDPAPEG